MTTDGKHKFSIGNKIAIRDGGVLIRGRVEHLSFDRNRKRQVLVRTGGKCTHRPSRGLDQTCLNCPEYYYEDDVEAVGVKIQG